MKKYRLILLLLGLSLTAAHPAWAAGRPLGPPKAAKKSSASNSNKDGKQLLRESQQRIAPYLDAAPQASKASATAAVANTPASSQLQIPNLPGSNPGPAPSTLGRPYSQEELTRSWAPYTYP